LRRFINGQEVELDPRVAKITRLGDRLIVHAPDGAYSALAVRSGDSVLVSFKGTLYTVLNGRPRARIGGAGGSGELRAPMPGIIVDVLVAKGDEVTKGQKVLVLEAMKTQQPFVSPFNGTIKELNVEKGVQVGDGDLLATVAPSESASQP
jgi:acetyl/propionyl-CoA carboxylase alpha subunit